MMRSLPAQPPCEMPHRDVHVEVLCAQSWPDYELIDVGEGRKLERFGSVVVDRPEPQALWMKTAPPDVWAASDLAFEAPVDQDSGRWTQRNAVPHAWSVQFGRVTALCRATSFRHVGVFPEQASHWRWIVERIENARRPLNLLNLFGYTGIASLLAAGAGATVTHVDASKKAIAWARENQLASGLDASLVRWICDDAKAFVRRELRRGRRYDAIILDPPNYGRGPKGEIWSLFDDLPLLLKDCRNLLSDDPSFILTSVYAVRLSLFSLAEVMKDIDDGANGVIEAGELLLRSTYGKRDLATSLFARWTPR
jgi:23S rRNA (cytosine1962-C5)-methyltransferase